MKFSEKDPGPFFRTLDQKVKNYFKENNISRFADHSILVKGSLVLLAYLSCYFILLNGSWKSPMTAFLLLVVMGLSGVMIVFNLVHDASHRTLFRSRRWNAAVTLLGDLVGINTYIWDIRHNIQHHSFTNVLGGDIIIDNIPLIRLSPGQKLYGFHRYQKWYAPLMYMLYTLYWMFVIDFRLFVKRDIGNLRNLHHPKIEWFKLCFFKGFYVFYTLVVPVLFFHIPLSFVLLGFLVMHLAAGTLLSAIALLGHFVEGPSFPEPDENDLISNSWMKHEFEETVDFSTGSKWMNWITGGLNTHIAHHLFPRICHCHYYQLSKIIKQHCMDHHLPYRQHSFVQAVASHFRYLSRLSVPEKTTAPEIKDHCVHCGNNGMQRICPCEQSGYGKAV